MVQDGGSTKNNLTLSMPILIGNIPLRSVDASYSDGSVAGSMIQSSLGNGSNNHKLKASSITDYPNLRNVIFLSRYCYSYFVLLMVLTYISDVAAQPRYEQGHVFPSTDGRSNTTTTSKYVTYAI